MLAPPDEAAPAGPVPCERLAAWCTLQPTGSTQTSMVRATSWPRRRPAGHRQNRRRAFLRCLVSTHGDDLRSWVHPWRWFRFSSPPMAPFLQLRGRRAVMARSGVRDPRPGHFSTHGDDLPSRLHLWRRFGISPPPMAIVLVLHCRRGANIACSCIRDSGHGHFSTHGDDLPSRLHLWRRFWISPPPMAIVLVLHCRGGANTARSRIRDSGHGPFSTDGDALHLGSTCGDDSGFRRHPRRRFPNVVGKKNHLPTIRRLRRTTAPTPSLRTNLCERHLRRCTEDAAKVAV